MQIKTLKLDDPRIKRMTFSGGERHIQTDALCDEKYTEILARLQSANDIMDLLLLTNILKSRGSQPDRLIIPYLPYARQDRHTTDHSPYSLEVMAGLINNLGYKQVELFDCHSDKSLELINNCIMQDSYYYVKQFINIIGPDKNWLIVAPDNGATFRATRTQLYISGFTDIGQCTKERDPSNGHLVYKSFSKNMKNRNILIVDDCLDGGKTFELLYDMIKPEVKEVALFVSHGIFSKGESVVTKNYNYVGCTDSFMRIQEKGSKLKVFKYIPLSKQ